jgi:hypothetical protein
LNFQKVDTILEKLKADGKRKTYLDEVVVNHY